MNNSISSDRMCTSKHTNIRHLALQFLMLASMIGERALGDECRIAFTDTNTRAEVSSSSTDLPILDNLSNADLSEAISQYRSLLTQVTDARRAGDHGISPLGASSLAALQSELKLREQKLVSLGVDKSVLTYKPLSSAELQSQIEDLDRLNVSQRDQTAHIRENIDSDWHAHPVTELNDNRVTVNQLAKGEKYLLLGTDNGKIFQVEIATGRVELKLQLKNNLWIDSISVAHDSNIMVLKAHRPTTGQHHLVSVRTDNYSIINEIVRTKPTESEFLISPNGKVFVESNPKGGLTLYNTESLRETSMKPVKHILLKKTVPARFSKSGRYLAVWTKFLNPGYQLRVFDTHAGQLVESFNLHQQEMGVVQFSEDETEVLILTHDRLIKSIITGQTQMGESKFPFSTSLRQVFSMNGRHAIVDSRMPQESRTLTIIDTKTGKPRSAHIHNLSVAGTFDISSDARTIIIRHSGKVVLWKPKNPFN